MLPALRWPAKAVDGPPAYNVDVPNAPEDVQNAISPQLRDKKAAAVEAIRARNAKQAAIHMKQMEVVIGIFNAKPDQTSLAKHPEIADPGLLEWVMTDEDCREECVKRMHAYPSPRRFLCCLFTCWLRYPRGVSYPHTPGNQRCCQPFLPRRLLCAMLVLRC